MSKIIIIKKNEEFQNIFEKGHSINGRYLVVYFLHTFLNTNRVGFCVGRKIGNAVTRNRIKRLLRESVRTSNVDNMNGWDILLVAKSPILKASLVNIIFEFEHILGKAGLNRS